VLKRKEKTEGEHQFKMWTRSPSVNAKWLNCMLWKMR